ncbi:MAG: Glutathione biosynthesis bifunctional protein GshAB [Chlamydiae bacterium]|nr:Glutathione biosynthesis bifunctional protein GshAB [Chlamydiota bacterium]
MEQAFEEKLDRLRSHGALLLESLHGLEKECFRINEDGTISQAPHPKVLGSSLMHPFISTDFSESQLEMIAPPFSSEEKLMEFMKLLHRYIYHHLGEERIWPFSAPCMIDDEIPIAQYGSSNFAYEKELYRKGLHYRYGSTMQALSGVHYNFSFCDELLKLLDPSPKSEAYLHIVRNYLRYGWLTTYLFGATPVYDETYFETKPKNLELLAPHTIGGPYATSLRMSEYGYYSKVQTQVGISFNSFDEYIQELEHAVSTPAKVWKEIQKGNQINDSIIQIEAEHYSRIRPKPPVNQKLRPLDSLKKDGITYLEVRGMDLYPWSIEGTDTQQLVFLHTFLLYCLLKESPPISKKEEKNLTFNQNIVALHGRLPTLSLHFTRKEKTLKAWANQLIDEMRSVAELLDSSLMTREYTDSLSQQQQKIDNPEKTPSARILKELTSQNVSFRDFGLALANKFREEYLQKNLPKPFKEELDKLANKSLEDQKALERYDDFILKGYEDLELSTQALLREAFKRGVEVEALDRKGHFFRLKKGDHVQYVKQATMTSLDSLITYLQMENKDVTKNLLSEKGFSVPKGILCFDPKEALEKYHEVQDQKLVIKPNRMNYGIGIYTVEKQDLAGYEAAIGKAFEYGQEVVIERFLEGEEYRFFVIDHQVVAICKRIPANVIGDGKHSIRELIEIKNHDSKYYKIPKYYLRAGEEEAEYLAHQGLNFEVVPEEGTQVFIRENSNVSTGGDSIDMTDEIHPGYSEIAVQGAQVAEATFCGVDIMIQDIREAPTSDNHGIIELNFNPAIWIHRYPTYGEKRYVERHVLDALGFRG